MSSETANLNDHEENNQRQNGGKQARWIEPGRGKLLALYCCIAFLSQFAPSEPFLTPFLIEEKGLTEEQVNNQVYTVWTYTYLVCLVFAGPLTEFIGYFIAILIYLVALIATRAILVWGKGLLMMQLMQVTFGIATSMEVAFYSYIYRLFQQQNYQRVTSLTRASGLISHTVAGILGQILVLKDSGYMILFHITLVAILIGAVLGLFVPKKATNEKIVLEEVEPPKLIKKNMREYFKILKEIYTKKEVALWSVWWCLCFCGLLSFEGYASSIWYAIDHEIIFNGFCDSLARLAGAGGAVLPAFLSEKTRERFGELTVFLSVFVCIIFSVIMAKTSSIWVAYCISITFAGVMYFTLSLSSAQIASHMPHNYFAFVFGVNTFSALILQTILQLVCGSTGLDVSIRERFEIYSFYFAAVTVLVFIVLVWNFVVYIRKKNGYRENSDLHILAQSEQMADSDEDR